MNATDIWVNKQLRDVDEDGTACARIVLRSAENGTPWETFSIIRTGEHRTQAAELCEEINQVLAGLAEQFPPGKTTVLLVALDADGAQIAQTSSSVHGRNKAAGAGALIQNEAGAAMAQTMTAFADTFRQVTGTINAQFALNMRHCEQLQKTVIEQFGYIQAMNERRVVEAENEATRRREEEPSTDKLVNAFTEQLPVLLELAKNYMETKSTGAGNARSATTAILKTVSNGESSK